MSAFKWAFLQDISLHKRAELPLWLCLNRWNGMCQNEGLVEPYAEVIQCIHAWQLMSLWRVRKSHTVMGCVMPAARGLLSTARWLVGAIAPGRSHLIADLADS